MQGIWLAAITLLEAALGGLSYGWLWAGLLFCLISLSSLSSLFGCLEVGLSPFNKVS